MASEVVFPASANEAVAGFGTGEGITVLGGGTVLMPELAAQELDGLRVMSLDRAGLNGVTRAAGRVTIGGMTSVAALEQLDEPLATAARHVADPEIRAQATIGGNLCIGASRETPRGDLQAPLLALDAQVRSAAAGAERTEPIEDFLATTDARLLLDVSYVDTQRATGYAAASRPHAHHYTILAACAARSDNGTRVAVTGAGPRGRRCASVEAALATGSSAADAALHVLDDVADDLRDDALASRWYRERVLPVIVGRALAQLEEARS